MFRRKRNGQVSLEHALILALAFLILIPGTMIFYNYSKTTHDQVIKIQVKRIGDEIIKNAQIMNTLGNHSNVTITVNVPRAVKSFEVGDQEMNFSILTYKGFSEVIFFHDINMAGGYSGSVYQKFHSGITKFKIASFGNNTIQIIEVN